MVEGVSEGLGRGFDLLDTHGRSSFMTDVEAENDLRFSLFIRHMPSASVTKGLNAALVVVPLMSLDEALLAPRSMRCCNGRQRAMSRSDGFQCGFRSESGSTNYDTTRIPELPLCHIALSTLIFNALLD